MLEKLTAQHSFCRSQLQLYEEHLRRDVSVALGGFGMMIPQLLEDWKFKDDQTYCLLGTVIFEPYNKCSTWRCSLTICMPFMYGILKPWLGQYIAVTIYVSISTQR